MSLALFATKSEESLEGTLPYSALSAGWRRLDRERFWYPTGLLRLYLMVDVCRLCRPALTRRDWADESLPPQGQAK
jgi:hypothetical protein